MTGERYRLDYFYGLNCEQYSFYRIPKLLFTADEFKGISCEAKVLYGLMLDRMGLSMKNRWFDEKNRVYIIFKGEEIEECLGCGSQKATKITAELAASGLIEKRRMGLGIPNIIYVKNFMNVTEQEEVKPEDVCDPDAEQTIDSEQRKTDHKAENTLLSLENLKNGENHKSRMVKITNQESRKSQIKNSENHKSRMMKITNQESRKSPANKTENNDTENNNQSIYPSVFNNINICNWRMERVIEVVHKQIDYENLIRGMPESKANIDNLVAIIADVLKLPPDEKMRMGSVERLIADVQQRFRAITSETIMYVLGTLEAASKNTKFRNIRSYVLVALYNAPGTDHIHIRATANYDIAHWGETEGG